MSFCFDLFRSVSFDRWNCGIYVEWCYDVSSTDSRPIRSASDSVSGSLRFNVSGNLTIKIDAMTAITPNVRYGNISKYLLCKRKHFMRINILNGLILTRKKNLFISRKSISNLNEHSQISNLKPKM